MEEKALGRTTCVNLLIEPREIAQRCTNNIESNVRLFPVVEGGSWMAKPKGLNVRFPVVEEGSWMAKPKGLNQVAWERGYAKADLIELHDAW
jgi:hypothetical protein